MSGTLRLRGSTSGYSELQAPAVAADQTFVLPTAGGTLLTTDSPVPKLTLELGSASQPSLTFQGDTDTGLFSEGTNTLNLVTGGSSKVVLGAAAHTIYAGTGATVRAIDIDSSGRLLVGTSTATDNTRLDQKLGIVSNNANSGGIRLTQNPGAVSSAAPIIDFRKTRGSTDGSHTIVANNDHLGYITFGAADGTDNESQAALITAQVDGTPGADDMPGRLVFSTTADGASSPTERMRIDNQGKLVVTDIGSTAFLSAANSYAQAMISSNVGGLVINSTDTTASSYCRLIFTPNGNLAGNEGLIRYNTNDFHMAFYTQGNERMRITSGGNIGINNSNPLYQIHVKSNSSASSQRIDLHMTNDTTGHGSGNGVQFGYQNVNGAYIWNFESTPIYFGTSNNERMRILSTGGLTFNGDTAAANALDDYEEGIWTPAIYVNSGTHPTYTVTNNYSSYTKVGSLVTFSADIVVNFSSVGSGTGLRISLPFAPSVASGRTVYSGGPQGRASTGFYDAAYEISWYYFSDGARLYRQSANGGDTALSTNDLRNVSNARYNIGGFYYVD